jgi:hypothetical protein
MPNGEICLRIWSQHATRVARVCVTYCSSLAKAGGDNSGIILHDQPTRYVRPTLLDDVAMPPACAALPPLWSIHELRTWSPSCTLQRLSRICVSFRNAPAVMVANEGEVESQAGKPLNSLVHHHVVKVEPGEPGCRRAWKSSRGMRSINFEHSEC